MHLDVPAEPAKRPQPLVAMIVEPDPCRKKNRQPPRPAQRVRHLLRASRMYRDRMGERIGGALVQDDEPLAIGLRRKAVHASEPDNLLAGVIGSAPHLIDTAQSTPL